MADGALKVGVISRPRRGFSLRVKISLFFILVIIPTMFGAAVLAVNRESNVIEDNLIDEGRLAAQTGAVTLGLFFEEAITNGVLTEAEVFDTAYRMIPDSDPARYHTAYDDYADRVSRAWFHSYLNNNDSILYVAAVDQNGYVPAHQAVSAEGGPDGFLDGGKCIFDDEVGMAAARNEEPCLVQEYRCAAGETVWDLSAPVYVNGQHWGAFRVGVSATAAEGAVAGALKPWAAAFGVVLVFVIMILASARAVARSVELMRRAFEKAGAGDFSRRVALDSCAEFSSLAAAFNRMLDSLESRSKTEWLQKAAVEEANLKLREMLVADELTNARSRKYLFERLWEEINVGQRTGKKLSVIFFDIDGFKSINDRYGHRVGDRFLTELIASIAKQLRPYDVLARYGGDEFVILSPGTPYLKAKELAERVRRKVAETIIEADGRPVGVTLSMGVASVERFDAEPAAKVAESLLVEADERAYQAKRLGGNRVV